MKETILFEADDGTIFKNRIDCLQHEVGKQIEEECSLYHRVVDREAKPSSRKVPFSANYSDFYEIDLAVFHTTRAAQLFHEECLLLNIQSPFSDYNEVNKPRIGAFLFDDNSWTDLTALVRGLEEKTWLNFEILSYRVNGQTIINRG